MKRLSLLLFLASVAFWPARPFAQQNPPSAGAGRLIEVTATDKAGKYLFEPAVINAKPGELLRIRMKSVSVAMAKMPKAAMSHNFVLIKAGVDPQQFANSGIPAGFAAGYIPADKKDVIAATPLAGVGETVEVSFKAPAAGSYPYICTFPGHLAGGMKGSLVVK
jgi:azurin